MTNDDFWYLYHNSFFTKMQGFKSKFYRSRNLNPLFLCTLPENVCNFLKIPTENEWKKVMQKCKRLHFVL